MKSQTTYSRFSHSIGNVAHKLVLFVSRSAQSASVSQLNRLISRRNQRGKAIVQQPFLNEPHMVTVATDCSLCNLMYSGH